MWRFVMFQKINYKEILNIVFLLGFGVLVEGSTSGWVVFSSSRFAWFSFDPSTTHSDIVLSNNKLTVSCNTFDHRVAVGNVGFSKGIHYWELTFDRYDEQTDPAIGICRYDVDKSVILGKDDRAWSMYIDEKRSWYMHRDEHTNRTDGGISQGSTIGVLLDLNQHTLSYFVDDVPHGPIAFTNIHGVFYPAVSINRNVQISLRTGLVPPVDVSSEEEYE